jgi:hypothetical protein
MIEYIRDTQRPLEVASSGDARFAGSVELAVRFGKTLLLLEVRMIAQCSDSSTGIASYAKPPQKLRAVL